MEEAYTSSNNINNTNTYFIKHRNSGSNDTSHKKYYPSQQ